MWRARVVQHVELAADRGVETVRGAGVMDGAEHVGVGQRRPVREIRVHAAPLGLG